MCFDPDDISRPNGQFLGFPYSLDASQVVFFPVPWDVTASYGGGAAEGPQAIIDASVQLEPTDYHVPEAWKIGHYTVPISEEIKRKNHQYRRVAKAVIAYQEQGNAYQDRAIESELKAVNQASKELNDWVYTETNFLLQQKKLVGLIGGDHSVPYGYIKALTEHYPSYGILQIDAHADLRKAYEGFTNSHASIMHNVLNLSGISHLVQVGLRDFSQGEMEQARKDQRVTWFTDWELKEQAYQGDLWSNQCQKIIDCLPDRVYISFDIDGLSPHFCPHTGTPVPGGLDFNQAIYLLKMLVRAGKKIIGFDLCEVSPHANHPDEEWDGNVGARVAYKLADLMFASHHISSNVASSCGL